MRPRPPAPTRWCPSNEYNVDGKAGRSGVLEQVGRVRGAFLEEVRDLR